MVRVFVFCDSSTHLDMAMNWPDGVPLNGESFDYTDTPTFTDDIGRVHVALTAFHHVNQDLASDPVSTNRRFYSDIPVLGTVVVADSTGDSIQVLLPDYHSTGRERCAS